MAFIHPIIQAITIAIGLYVGYLGWQRFRGRMFQWKRHIRLGFTFFVMIIAGTAIGFTITYLLEGGIFKTGLHALLPFIIVPLLLIGVILGFFIEREQRKGLGYPIHGHHQLLYDGIDIPSGLRGSRSIKGTPQGQVAKI